jgi:hypothetical protein
MFLDIETVSRMVETFNRFSVGVKTPLAIDWTRPRFTSAKVPAAGRDYRLALRGLYAMDGVVSHERELAHKLVVLRMGSNPKP